MALSADYWAAYLPQLHAFGTKSVGRETFCNAFGSHLHARPAQLTATSTTPLRETWRPFPKVLVHFSPVPVRLRYQLALSRQGTDRVWRAYVKLGHRRERFPLPNGTVVVGGHRWGLDVETSSQLQDADSFAMFASLAHAKVHMFAALQELGLVNGADAEEWLS